ncbi:MAG: hypothetical protein RIR70_834, partial [Pseudomonadota bacterium]
MQRRAILKWAACSAGLLTLPRWAVSRERAKIYVITYRGPTAADQAFIAHLKNTDLAPEFLLRDVNQDVSRLPPLLEEIRTTKPDLIFTWGTNVTEGVVGRLGAVDPRAHITDI